MSLQLLTGMNFDDLQLVAGKVLKAFNMESTQIMFNDGEKALLIGKATRKTIDNLASKTFYEYLTDNKTINLVYFFVKPEMFNHVKASEKCTNVGSAWSKEANQLLSFYTQFHKSMSVCLVDSHKSFSNMIIEVAKYYGKQLTESEENNLCHEVSECWPEIDIIANVINLCEISKNTQVQDAFERLMNITNNESDASSDITSTEYRKDLAMQGLKDFYIQSNLDFKPTAFNKIVNSSLDDENELVNENVKFKQDIKNQNEIIKDLKKELKKYKRSAQALDKQKDKIVNIQKENALLMKQIYAVQTALEKCHFEIQEKEAVIITKEENLVEKQNEIIELSKVKQELHLVNLAMTEYKDYKTVLDDELQKLYKERESLNISLQEKNKLAVELKNANVSNEQVIQRLNFDKEELENKMNEQCQDLTLCEIQINQLSDELEYYFENVDSKFIISEEHNVSSSGEAFFNAARLIKVI